MGQDMADGIKLVVGLGNPGQEYDQTRHNVGFWLLDQLANNYRADFRSEKKFHGEICKIDLGVKPVWLLKPMTYMNKSGLAVSALVNYYKILPEEVLVVHDELDHEAGDVRLKKGGGHAGHNGLRDIISSLGCKDFYRLRLGIGHPGSKSKVVNYVLGTPGRDDKIAIDLAIDNALSEISLIIDGEFEKAMNRLN